MKFQVTSQFTYYDEPKSKSYFKLLLLRQIQSVEIDGGEKQKILFIMLPWTLQFANVTVEVCVCVALLTETLFYH